jgi:hypothetical protein
VTLLDHWRPANRRERLADEQLVDALLWAWRTACTGSDLATVVNAAAGPTESVPSVVDPAIGYCALFGTGQVAM